MRLLSLTASQWSVAKFSMIIRDAVFVASMRAWKRVNRGESVAEESSATKACSADALLPRPIFSKSSCRSSGLSAMIAVRLFSKSEVGARDMAPGVALVKSAGTSTPTLLRPPSRTVTSALGSTSNPGALPSSSSFTIECFGDHPRSAPTKSRVRILSVTMPTVIRLFLSWTKLR